MKKANPCWLVLYNIANEWTVTTRRIGGPHIVHNNVTQSSRLRFEALARSMRSRKHPVSPLHNGWCWLGERDSIHIGKECIAPSQYNMSVTNARQLVLALQQELEENVALYQSLTGEPNLTMLSEYLCGWAAPELDIKIAEDDEEILSEIAFAITEEWEKGR